MVAVPSSVGKNPTAADISSAVDKGQFYASTGVELEYELDGSSAPDALRVSATEPVVWGVTGGGWSD